MACLYIAPAMCTGPASQSAALRHGRPKPPISHRPGRIQEQSRITFDKQSNMILWSDFRNIALEGTTTSFTSSARAIHDDTRHFHRTNRRCIHVESPCPKSGLAASARPSSRNHDDPRVYAPVAHGIHNRGCTDITDSCLPTVTVPEHISQSPRPRAASCYR